MELRFFKELLEVFQKKKIPGYILEENSGNFQIKTTCEAFSNGPPGEVANGTYKGMPNGTLGNIFDGTSGEVNEGTPGEILERFVEEFPEKL